MRGVHFHHTGNIHLVTLALALREGSPMLLGWPLQSSNISDHPLPWRASSYPLSILLCTSDRIYCHLMHLMESQVHVVLLYYICELVKGQAVCHSLRYVRVGQSPSLWMSSASSSKLVPTPRSFLESCLSKLCLIWRAESSSESVPELGSSLMSHSLVPLQLGPSTSSSCTSSFYDFWTPL